MKILSSAIVNAISAKREIEEAHDLACKLRYILEDSQVSEHIGDEFNMGSFTSVEVIEEQTFELLNPDAKLHGNFQ